MYTIRKLPVHFSPHMFVRFPIFFIKFIIRCVHSVCAHVQWKKLHFENFILSPPVAYTGGEAVVLLPPMGFLGKGKNQVFWVKKRACPHHQRGVFSLKKYSWKFSWRFPPFIFKIYRCISILSKISTPLHTW